jgi:hypothetical protein
MNRRSILNFSAFAAAGFAMVASGEATAQQKALKDQLIGTWSLVSYDSIAADGSKKPVFGAQPRGYVMLDAGGRYTYILVDMSRAKWKGTDRTQTTVEEYAAAAKGLVAQFGTWSVDEASKTFIRKVEGALNPGLPGVEQKLTLGLSADELTLADSTSQVTGGKTEQRYRRAK